MSEASVPMSTPSPLLSDGKQTSAVVPVWLLRESDVADWRAAQPEAVGRWLGAHQFNGERQRLLLLPDAANGLGGAVLGLGTGPGIEALSPWQVAPLAERLPAGVYRFAQPLSAASAAHAALGWSLGAIRPASTASRPATPTPRLIVPQGVDLEAIDREVRACGFARDLINRPANALGPAELAEAVR